MKSSGVLAVGIGSFDVLFAMFLFSTKQPALGFYMLGIAALMFAYAIHVGGRED